MPGKKILLEKKRKTIGIALGGGAAKGLAHVGVLKALEEARIPIDFVAGTSMGAVVGGWYAMDGDIASMEEFVSALEKKDRKSLAQVSIKKGRPKVKDESIMKIIDKHFGERRFESCKIPFKAVATDVKNGDEVVISEGKIANAIKASAAIPIIFDSVEIGGKVLVDGGMVNPIPADVVREMGADIVIAVDVSTKWFDVSSLSGSSLSLRNIQSIFYALIAVFGYQISKEKLKKADIVIKPPVLGYKMLDFRRAEDIIATGYKTARGYYGDICRITGCEPPKKNALDEFWEFVLGLE
jgi:NTE family protein